MNLHKKIYTTMQREMAEHDRVHLLCLIPSLGGGGAERVMVTLVKHFDRSIFRLTLAVVDSRRNCFREEVPSDVEFIDLNCRRVRYALPKIVKLAWRLKPDVMFSTLGHLNLALAAARPLLPPMTRLIVRETVVVSADLSYSPKGCARRWAYRLFSPRPDLVICQSLDMRNDLVDNFGLPAGKTVVINNLVDVDLIGKLASESITATGYKEGVINLVTAGRFCHQKGFDLLLDALALCHDKKLRLTILGEGPLRTDLELHASRLGLNERVRFVGFQENPYPFFAQADAFVLSSRYEGFPNVIIESLACGTPVIAVPAPGGVREIAELTNGVFVASSVTKEALAQVMRAFARGRFSLQIPPRLENFAVENIVPQYERSFLSSGCETSNRFCL